MNRITSALPTTAVPRPVGRLHEPIDLTALRSASQDPVKPLDGLRFSDLLIDGATAVYELGKRVVLAVYRFFAVLFSSSILAKAVTLDVSDFVKIEKDVYDPKEAKKLSEALKATFPSKVHYCDDKDPVEFGTYIFDHLLEQGRGGVQLDPESGIYTVNFPEAKRVSVIFNEETKKRLNGHVVDPVLSHGKAVLFKLGEGRMELLGDSLTASAKIKVGILGEIDVDTTVEGMIGQAPHPFAETHMLGAIRLNEGTNSIIRGIVNNVVCPLVNTDLSRIRVRREPAIRLLHTILHPSK